MRLPTIPPTVAAKSALLDLMCELSEEHWCAGWIGGLGPALWHQLHHDNANAHGLHDVPLKDKEMLRALSTAAGGWFAWCNDARDVVFVPMDEWQARVAERSDV